MTQTVRVELTRTADAAGILVDMTARGFEGELERSESGVAVVLAGRGETPEQVLRKVWLGLEESIASRHLPLVPFADAAGSFVLRPAFV
ncbi:MAG: hypothetical protein U0R69_00380 [Gaiellales bacterium]